MITKKALLIGTVFASTLVGGTGESLFNPSIGFTGDIVTDISDVNGQWREATSEGIAVRSGELILGAAIDPYAELTANVNFTLDGVELHELYSHFHSLPANLSLKAGWKLAQVGRWNQFHAHAMPFTADPRLLIEYQGGHFSTLGTELSWLAPTPFFLELTAGVSEGWRAHTHDSDPSAFDSDLDQRAAELGLTKHGSHWHGSNGEIVDAEEIQDPEEPITTVKNKPIGSFPLLGRAKSSVQFGENWSADLGVSGIWRKDHRFSNRVEGKTYSKAVVGSDLTLFWHPLTANKYRNLDLGAEWLGTYEENELLFGETVLQENRFRHGVFGHVHYRHNQRLHFGTYGELFQANESDLWLKKRVGLFTTVELTHYQYLRLEGSSYRESPNIDPVHRLTLQYDMSIGFHSHGTQR